LKVCSDCGKEKDLSEFYFRKDHNKYRNQCIECLNNKKKLCYIKNRKQRLDKQKDTHKKYPWKRALAGLKQRCNNKNKDCYHRYGEWGIKCLITKEELKEIWFRDKAWLLKIPTLDRENNNGNYE